MFQLKNLSAIALLLLAPLSWALDSDKNQAITIEADSAIVNDKKGETIYKGDVVVKQGTMLLKSDILTVTQHPNTKQATQFSAHGSPAFFEQLPKADEEKIQAEAKTILFITESDTIELIGNANLKQGTSEISSDKIIYLAKEKIFQAKQEENNKGEKKRVQVTIPAPKKQKQQNQEQEQDPSHP